MFCTGIFLKIEDCEWRLSFILVHTVTFTKEFQDISVP